MDAFLRVALCLFLLLGVPCGGFSSQKLLPFSCPHRCGEWGSESVREVEETIKEAVCYERNYNSVSKRMSFIGHPSIYWAVDRKKGGYVFNRELYGEPEPLLHCFVGCHIDGCRIFDKDPIENGELRPKCFFSLKDALYVVLEGGNICLAKDTTYHVNPFQGTLRLESFASLVNLTDLVRSDSLSCCLIEFIPYKFLTDKRWLEDTHRRITRYENRLERYGPKYEMNFNYLDLNEEIEKEIGYAKRLEKRMKTVFEEAAEKSICRRRKIEIFREEHVLPLLDEAETKYLSIHQNCAKNHKSPIAFYNLALKHFCEGDHMRALKQLSEVLERTDLEALENYQASHVFQTGGKLRVKWHSTTWRFKVWGKPCKKILKIGRPTLKGPFLILSREILIAR